MRAAAFNRRVSRSAVCFEVFGNRERVDGVEADASQGTGMVGQVGVAAHGKSPSALLNVDHSPMKCAAGHRRQGQ